jgi:hypothetical protein
MKTGIIFLGLVFIVPGCTTYVGPGPVVYPYPIVEHIYTFSPPPVIVVRPYHPWGWHHR